MRSYVVLAVVSLTLICGACRRSPEERNQKAIERGKQLMASKDYARAVLEFKNAVQAMPGEAESHYQLGLAFVATGDVAAAIRAFRRSTELNPSHSAAQVKLAEILSTAPREDLLKDAVQRMETVLSSDPANVDALSTLATVEMRLGEYSAAEEHLSKALEKGPTNLKAAVGLARVRLSQKRFEEAEQILKRATEHKPPTALAFIVLGQYYIGTKREEDAKREFLRAIEIESGNAIALTYLGNLYAKAGQMREADDVFRRLSALPQKAYKPIHAMFLLKSGQRDEAIRELEQLHAADRLDRTVRRQLLTAYLSAGRTADVERVLEEALKKNKKDTDALLYKSNLLISSAKFNEALDNLTQVLNYEPNSAHAHYLLAQVHAARGNQNSWRQELSEVVRLNSEFMPARLEFSRSLMTSNLKSALEVIDSAPEWQKQDPRLIVQRNWIFAAMGDRAELKKGVEAGIKVSRSADLMIQDALVKIDARDFNGARAVLDETMKTYPEDTRGIELMVRAYAAQGQAEAGLKKAREHAAAHLKSARVQHHLGMLMQGRGIKQDARNAFLAAKSADASFWPADLAMAALDLSENKLDAARARLEPLLERPQAALNAHLLLAEAEQKKNNPQGAIEHYRKAIEIQPNSVLVLNNLAYALIEWGGAPDDALKMAERAKELAPDNATIDDTLGWILYRRGLHARAVQHLEMSVKKQPNATRHAHLALAYAAKGDTVRGFEQLQAAMKLDPAIPEVSAAQKALAARK